MADLISILLVEDNQDDYEAMVRSLKKNHFVNPIQWCKTGSDALDFLLRRGKYIDHRDWQTPQLILLDLNMPGVDGRQLLRIIKQDEVLRSIPVVILSTSTDPNDVGKSYSIGANSYIQKPVSFHGLTEAIRTMKDYWFGVAILPSRQVTAT